MDNISQKSYPSQNYSNITRYSDEDNTDDSKLDLSVTDQQISTNIRVMRVIYAALDYLAQKNFQDAIESFNSCLRLLEASKDSAKLNNYYINLVHCNKAMCYFYMSSFEECESNLKAAWVSINSEPNIKMEQYKLLYLKILCNFLVLYIKMRVWDNTNNIKEQIYAFIDNETNPSKKANYLITVIYMLFRKDSVQYIGISDEDQYGQLTPHGFGIYLMINAINYDIANQKDKANQAFNQALEHWHGLEDQVMCLLTLRYQMALYEKNKMNYDKIKRYYEEEASMLNYDSHTLTQLFEEFNDKIICVKDLASNLKELEIANNQFIASLKEQNHVGLVRLVARISLKQNISAINKLLKQGRENPQKQQELNNGLFFLDKTLKLIEAENSQSMINLITNHSFVSKALNRIKSAVSVINRGFHLIYYKEAFNMIRGTRRIQIGQKKGFGKFDIGAIQKKTPSMKSFNHINPKNYVDSQIHVSMTESISNPLSLLSQHAQEVITKGEYLNKLNYTTNGQLKKFFKIFGGTTIRWGKKPESLKDIKLCHSFLFSEIKGIVYGKCTSTFKKSKNKNLEPWLCFSLMLKTRPLDVYCNEDQINSWYIGLSQLIKLHNPNAYALNKGQYYWRKLNYLFRYFVMVNMPELQRKAKKGLTFCKAVLLYNAISGRR